MVERLPITAAGYRRLEERLKVAKEERSRVVQEIATARAHFEASLPLARQPRFGVVVFRKHLARYLKGIPHSRERRIELLGLTEPDAMRAAFDAFEAAWREGEHAPEAR